MFTGGLQGFGVRRVWVRLALMCLAFFAAGSLFAEAPATLRVDLNAAGDEDLGTALKLLLLVGLLTLAPAIMMLTTSFTRIVIVLGFVRSALGVHGSPSNQIIIGLALFLTFFMMGPTLDNIYEGAIVPYQEKQMTSMEAFDEGVEHLKDFMLRQTRESDLEFFLQLSQAKLGGNDDGLPMRIVIPSFILSELRTAFQMGFMVFVPFLVIDFLVASTLMAMGMMMMPPAIIALPFKILLFVLVDGWYLVVRSLVDSFS